MKPRARNKGRGAETGPVQVRGGWSMTRPHDEETQLQAWSWAGLDCAFTGRESSLSLCIARGESLGETVYLENYAYKGGEQEKKNLRTMTTVDLRGAR